MVIPAVGSWSRGETLEWELGADKEDILITNDELLEEDDAKSITNRF